jgi:hypothetical protein
MENIVYFSDTITNQLEILNGQAQGFNGQFVISASAKQKSTNETKKITYPVNFNVVPIDAKIPLNDHFFTFSDDEKTTILDFSIDLLNAAKESTTAVDAYLFGRSILDLSGKKIDGDATFSPKYNPTSLENGCNENINRILTKITEINLSGAIFLPKIINNECKTGFLTFGRIINGSETTIPPPPVSAEDTTNGCYLANVQKLDLSGAIFAQTNMSNNTDICKTAANTFANANLSGLTNNNLILTNTNFASTNMAINTNNIYTAYQTFSTAIISNSLNFNLSLENTNFAVDNMTSSVTSIYTAANTFGNSILTTTNTISLSNAKFAAHSMCNGGIHTAYQTFLVDTSDTYQTITNSFPAINQLILDNAVFSIDNMASENNNSSIYIAESTFNKANFSNLSTLNLNNISFVPNNLSIANNVSNIFVAASTFSETNLNGLNILNVNAKFACEQITKNASVSTAYCTFMNAKLDNVTNLDLTNAIFCVSNMISTNGSGSIKTADSLFKKVIFSGLQSLNLTNVNFACSDMGYNGSIFTANSTFESAEFTALTSLNVNATYITTSIVSELSSSSEIDIGCGTFSKAKFDVLQSLDLSQTIFAATNIINSSATSNIGAKIYTAASTFSFAEFTTLNSLNFNATYTIDNINNTSASIFTASQTFASTSIPSIQNIDLSNINFASSQMTTNGRVFTGFNTFSGLILSTSTTTLIFNNTKFVANSMSTSDNALI